MRATWEQVLARLPANEVCFMTPWLAPDVDHIVPLAFAQQEATTTIEMHEWVRKLNHYDSTLHADWFFRIEELVTQWEQSNPDDMYVVCTIRHATKPILEFRVPASVQGDDILAFITDGTPVPSERGSEPTRRDPGYAIWIDVPGPVHSRGIPGASGSPRTRATWEACQPSLNKRPRHDAPDDQVTWWDMVCTARKSDLPDPHSDSAEFRESLRRLLVKTDIALKAAREVKTDNSVLHVVTAIGQAVELPTHAYTTVRDCVQAVSAVTSTHVHALESQHGVVLPLNSLVSVFTHEPLYALAVHGRLFQPDCRVCGIPIRVSADAPCSSDSVVELWVAPYQGITRVIHVPAQANVCDTLAEMWPFIMAEEWYINSGRIPNPISADQCVACVIRAKQRGIPGGCKPAGSPLCPSLLSQASSSSQPMKVPSHESLVQVWVRPGNGGLLSSMFIRPDDHILDHLVNQWPEVPRHQWWSNSRQIRKDDQVGSFAHSVLRAKVTGLQGGVPKKVQLDTACTFVASSMLANGCPAASVSACATKVVTRLGAAAVNKISTMPHHEQWHALQEAIASAKISDVIPEKARSSNQPQIWAENPGKQMQPDLNLQGLRLPPNCFQNADGSPAVLLESFYGYGTGVCLLTPEKAAPWITNASTLSTDELAIVVLGDPGKLGNNGKSIQFKVQECDGASHIAQGCLINLGAKPISFKPAQNVIVDFQDRRAIVCSLFKCDHEAQWDSITKGPVKFLFQHIFDEATTSCILDTYGRSWQSQGKLVSPSCADVFRCTVLVPIGDEAAILKRSGLCGCFWSPKTSDGRPDDRHAVIWMKESLADVVKVVQRQVALNHMGIIRGRRGLAIRVLAADYAAAVKLLRPDMTSEEFMPSRFFWRLKAVPTGMTQTCLAAVSKQGQWKFRPVRRVRADEWVLASADQPGSDVLTVNECQMLLQPMQPEHKGKHPIVSDPHPRAKSKQHARAMSSASSRTNEPSVTSDPWTVQDPWSKYTAKAPQASTPAGSCGPGPVEARLAKQDEKIEQLKATLEKVRDSQDQENVKLRADFRKDLETMSHSLQGEIKEAAASASAANKDMQSSINEQLSVFRTDLLQALQSFKTQSPAKKKSKTGKGSDADMQDD